MSRWQQPAQASLFLPPTLPMVTCSDAEDWLRAIPPETFDLIVTDTAYESLEKHRAVGTTTRLQSWFPIFTNDRFLALFRELWRVLKPNTHLYFMCDQETMFVAKPIAEAAGFKFWKPLVWDKKTIGMGYHYRGQYELVLFFEKGERPLNDLSRSDVLSVPRVRGGYPTEKPEELIRILVEQSSEPGHLVGDPFLGSGAHLAAALRCGRKVAGCDLVEKACDEARARLEAIRDLR